MIYVTGDTHGLHDFNKLKVFAEENPNLSREDFVIIAGDFGGVWSEDTLKIKLSPYEELPFTVLFVDGNHENFDMLEKYPVEIWKGGKVHRIKENIIHLMRGQVFELEGNTVFTFGGGTSIDKATRHEGTSWWAQEIPSFEEMDEGYANLARYGNKVDYIITHSCDEKAIYYPALSRSIIGVKVYRENSILSNFEYVATYKHWYFGHYHVDGDLNDVKTALYQEIIPLGSSLS